MQQTNRIALVVILAAVVLGVLGDALLRVMPWGVNVPLYVAVVVAALFLAARAGWVPLSGGGRWLAIPALLCAFAYVWRDSRMLLAGDFLVILITLALLADRARAGRLRVAGAVDYASGLFMAGINAGFGALVLLFSDVQWRTLRQSAPTGRLSTGVTRVGVGLLLAVPLLVVFGGLFSAADANFAQLLNNLFSWDLNELILHAILFAFFAWISAGFLRMALLGAPAHLNVVDESGGRLGIVEIATVLGLLNVLFLAFVILQFRYLFGGASALGYAEYARRGFFELVTVAVLVLPVVLAGHWLLNKGSRASVRLFNVLAGSLIVLLFVVMASALQRMALYVNEFGLTELRLYTTAFMGGLALVFVWFIATTLRGQGDHFAFGMLAAGLVVTFALNVLNPDAFIAQINVGRIAQPTSGPSQGTNRAIERPLDATYLASLGADALPVWIDALPNVPQPDRCRAAAIVLARWTGPDADWRAWNISRAQARQIVESKRQYLQETACPIRE